MQQEHTSCCLCARHRRHHTSDSWGEMKPISSFVIWKLDVSNGNRPPLPLFTPRFRWSWYGSAVVMSSTTTTTPRPRPATAPRLTTMKVTCKRQQPERNTCCVPPPSARQFQLLFCILPFPSFTDALLECSKFREMINNIHVMGNDVLSSAEDGPLHWSARSKSFSFHGGSDSASSDLMRIDQTQLRGKDPLCTLWHGQCVLNNYLLCFPDLKKKANIVKQKLPGLRYISASCVSLAAIIRSKVS